MKANYTLISLFILSSVCYGQGWTALDLSMAQNAGNGSIVEHNGKLFTASADNRLEVSTDGGLTFTDITTDSIPGDIRYLVSAGNRLYLSAFSPFNASSIIWYTTDEGVSWSTDTVGLKNNFFGPPAKGATDNFISYNNGTQLIGSWDGADAYYRKAVTDAQWTKISFLDPIDPLEYASSNDTVYAVNSSTIYYSTDNAVTWTAMGNTGLPSFFVPRGFDVEGGRIYLGTDNTFQQEFKLYYTDDFGSTWDTLPVNHLLGTNWLGQPQRPGGLKATGNNIYIPLINDGTNTGLDIISSSDGGASFAVDTVGLKNDPFGTGVIIKFEIHQGKIFALNNFQTLYSKSLNATIGMLEAPSYDMDIYPNPATDKLYFTGNIPDHFEVKIYTLTGQLICRKFIYPGDSFIVIDDIPAGTYMLRSGMGFRKFSKTH